MKNSAAVSLLWCCMAVVCGCKREQLIPSHPSFVKVYENLLHQGETQAIAETPTGDFLLCMRVSEGIESYRSYLLRTDSLGNLDRSWNYTLPAPYLTAPCNSIGITPDGQYRLGGSVKNPDPYSAIMQISPAGEIATVAINETKWQIMPQNIKGEISQLNNFHVKPNGETVYITSISTDNFLTPPLGTYLGIMRADGTIRDTIPVPGSRSTALIDGRTRFTPHVLYPAEDSNMLFSHYSFRTDTMGATIIKSYFMCISEYNATTRKINTLYKELRPNEKYNIWGAVTTRDKNNDLRKIALVTNMQTIGLYYLQDTLIGSKIIFYIDELDNLSRAIMRVSKDKKYIFIVGSARNGGVLLFRIPTAQLMPTSSSVDIDIRSFGDGYNYIASDFIETKRGDILIGGTTSVLGLADKPFLMRINGQTLELDEKFDK